MFCPQILMGQVLTRMKLDWCGNDKNDDNHNDSDNGTRHRQHQMSGTLVWIFLTAAYWYARASLESSYSDHPVAVEDSLDDDGALGAWDAFRAFSGVSALFTVQELGVWVLLSAWLVLSAVVLARLRGAVRNAYDVPTGCAPGDCCLALCCQCCTVAQLARQTARYEEERAYCCTDTGLP